MFFSKFFRQICICSIFLSLCFTANAQKFYVRGDAVYNFGIGGLTAYETNGTVNETGQQNLTYQLVKLKLGSGWQVNANTGYFFSQHFGVELGLGYLKGKTHIVESRVQHTQYRITEAIDYKIAAPLLLIQTAVVVRGANKTITPYARLGTVIAKGEISEKQDHTLWNQKEAFESKYTGSGFGFQGGLGVDFKANKEVTFYMEAVVSNLNYSPKKWELTKATENEETYLYKIPTNEREIEFVDSYAVTYDSNGKEVADPNMPAQQPKKSIPFNSFGLGVGMKYTF